MRVVRVRAAKALGAWVVKSLNERRDWTMVLARKEVREKRDIDCKSSPSRTACISYRGILSSLPILEAQSRPSCDIFGVSLFLIQSSLTLVVTQAECVRGDRLAPDQILSFRYLT